MGSIAIKSTAAVLFAALGIGCGAPAANQTTAGNAAPVTASPSAANTTPAPQTASAKSGKELYTINCLTCHKTTGKGGKVTIEGRTINPDDLTSAKMKAKTDEKLYAYVADGIVDEGMPSFKDTLKPEEIRAVVAYVRELQSQ